MNLRMTKYNVVLTSRVLRAKGPAYNSPGQRIPNPKGVA